MISGCVEISSQSESHLDKTEAAETKPNSTGSVAPDEVSVSQTNEDKKSPTEDSILPGWNTSWVWLFSHILGTSLGTSATGCFSFLLKATKPEPCVSENNPEMKELPPNADHSASTEKIQVRTRGVKFRTVQCNGCEEIFHNSTR